MSQPSTNEQQVLALLLRIGPGHPPTRYEEELGLDRQALHGAVCALNRAGMLDTDVEMGSTWMGDIE